jgi:hypothetical protein
VTLEQKAQAEENAAPEVEVDGEEFGVADAVGLGVELADVATEFEGEGEAGKNQQRGNRQDLQQHEQQGQPKHAGGGDRQHFRPGGSAEANNGRSLARCPIVFHLVKVGAEQDQGGGDAEDDRGNEAGD